MASEEDLVKKYRQRIESAQSEIAKWEAEISDIEKYAIRACPEDKDILSAGIDGIKLQIGYRKERIFRWEKIIKGIEGKHDR